MNYFVKFLINESFADDFVVIAYENKKMTPQLWQIINYYTYIYKKDHRDHKNFLISKVHPVGILYIQLIGWDGEGLRP